MIRFRVLGIEISFSFWFFAVVACFALLSGEVLAIYFALPVVVHELGHLVAMAVCGMRIHAVRFTAVSVNIRRSAYYTGFAREAAVCLGGIIANLLFAWTLYLLVFQSMRAMFLIGANLAVALFNLLPIGNLDGGELMKLVAGRFFTPRAAWTVSKVMSFLVLVPLFAFGMFLLLSRSRNITLLLTCFYLALTVAARE